MLPKVPRRQCFQHFAVLTVGMHFSRLLRVFMGFVFCHCSGWNEATAMWSYLEKCHARQCFLHFACFLDAGVFRVQRACSASSSGLWGCAETLARKARFWSRKAWTLVTSFLVPHPCAVCCTKSRKCCNYQCFVHGRNMNDVLIPTPPHPNKTTGTSHQEVRKLTFYPRPLTTA